MVACITKAAHSIREGSKSHSFQDDVVNRLGQGAAGIGMQKPKDRSNQDKPKKANSKFGRYEQVVYKKGTKDCQVTYTCEYGLGFDEVRAPNGS